MFAASRVVVAAILTRSFLVCNRFFVRDMCRPYEAIPRLICELPRLVDALKLSKIELVAAILKQINFSHGVHLSVANAIKRLVFDVVTAYKVKFDSANTVYFPHNVIPGQPPPVDVEAP